MSNMTSQPPVQLPAKPDMFKKHKMAAPITDAGFNLFEPKLPDNKPNKIKKPKTKSHSKQILKASTNTLSQLPLKTLPNQKMLPSQNLKGPINKSSKSPKDQLASPCDSGRYSMASSPANSEATLPEPVTPSQSASKPKLDAKAVPQDPRIQRIKPLSSGLIKEYGSSSSNFSNSSTNRINKVPITLQVPKFAYSLEVRTVFQKRRFSKQRNTQKSMYLSRIQTDPMFSASILDNELREAQMFRSFAVPQPPHPPHPLLHHSHAMKPLQGAMNANYQQLDSTLKSSKRKSDAVEYVHNKRQSLDRPGV